MPSRETVAPEASGKVVAFAAAVLTTAVYLGLGALSLLGAIEFTNARANFRAIFPLAMIAAIGCWLLTRGFALRQ